MLGWFIYKRLPFAIPKSFVVQSVVRRDAILSNAAQLAKEPTVVNHDRREHLLHNVAVVFQQQSKVFLCIMRDQLIFVPIWFAFCFYRIAYVVKAQKRFRRHYMNTTNIIIRISGRKSVEVRARKCSKRERV